MRLLCTVKSGWTNICKCHEVFMFNRWHSKLQVSSSRTGWFFGGIILGFLVLWKPGLLKRPASLKLHLTESTCWLEIFWRALLLLLVLWINYGISSLKYVDWPWLLRGEKSTHSADGHSLDEQNNKMRKKGNPSQPHLLAAPCMTCCPDCPVRNRSMLKYLIPLEETFC